MFDVAVLNFNMGNLFSIKCALNYVGLSSIITDQSEEIMNSKSLIIPGVGAFPEAMFRIKKKNLVSTINKFNKKGKIIIGVCLGMQLLFSKSEEIKNTFGLNLIEGEVKKFSNNNQSKIKTCLNVGWNNIFTKKFINKESYVSNLNSKKMYFIHSFYVKPKNQNCITSTSFFNKKEFVSSVKKDNIQGFQFHPEKSREYGIKIYQELKNNLINIK